MELMKRSILALVLMSLMVAGCCDDEVIAVYDPPPQPPQGVFSITGNDSVFVYWTAPYEGDISYFAVYRSYEEFTGYREIALVDAVPNSVLDLIYYEPGYIDDSVTNGTTYFYAITSIDEAGQESELSAESVFDTPRPDGRVTLYDEAINTSASAFDFSVAAVVAYDDADADVWLNRFDGIFYLEVKSTVVAVIQPMGFHASFDGVGWAPWAPQVGWSYNGWAEIVPGHIYVMAMKDSHGDWNYAKMRVLAKDDDNDAVLFQWAYQEDKNNPELAPPVVGDPVCQQAQTTR